MPRVGIFICRCGGNISNVVDVEGLKEKLAALEGVALSEVSDFVCSRPGQEKIRQGIREAGLDRVVVASCTPKMHGKLFRDVVEGDGVNPYLFEMVNIREHLSWVHEDDSEGATAKAFSLISGAVARLLEQSPLEVRRYDVQKKVLVLGGGIAGITASLEASSSGLEVLLVERQPSIGGNMAKLSKTFPTLDCAQCILSPKMVDVASDENIRLYTDSELVSLEGSPGNYTARIRINPRFVDPKKCTSCGKCSKVCPVKTPNGFDEGLSIRKAIYLPFPQAVPLSYVVDPETCKMCKACSKVCPAGAIELEQQPVEFEEKVGAVIVATGYRLWDASAYEEFGFGRYKDVITSLQLERLLSTTGPTQGYLRRPSDGEVPKSVAFVHCVGSRDLHRGVSYCSKICCMYALKLAKLIEKSFEGVDVWMFYIDLRAAGKGYEELYVQTQEAGVKFVRGKVGEIYEDNGKLWIRAEDTFQARLLELDFDLIVLCPAMLPPEDSPRVAEITKAVLGEEGFIMEKHPKLAPVDTSRVAVYSCGCIVGPKDVRESVSEALATTARSVSFLQKGYAESTPFQALVIPERCTGCGICVSECPYEAISLSDGKAVVEESLCVGCGACVPICLEDALDQNGYREAELDAQISAILEARREGEIIIIAFAEEGLAYTAIDLSGLNHLNYPASIRVVPVPSGARLGKRQILKYFSMGADGIHVLESAAVEATFPEASKISEKRFNEMMDFLDENGFDSMHLRYEQVQIPQFPKVAQGFKVFHELISSLGPIDKEYAQSLLAQSASS